MESVRLGIHNRFVPSMPMVDYGRPFMTNSTRRQIRDHICDQPGIHFNALVRTSGFAPGQVQYHTRQLVGNEDVINEHLYGRTHYYPPTHNAWERRTLALVRRETARKILFYLLETQVSHPDEVADALDIARSTLEWHCDRLVKAGIIEKRMDNIRGHIVLEVAHPERTARLLAETTTTVPDRLVDRFMRLIDDLFDDTDQP